MLIDNQSLSEYLAHIAIIPTACRIVRCANATLCGGGGGSGGSGCGISNDGGGDSGGDGDGGRGGDGDDAGKLEVIVHSILFLV